MTVVGVTRLGVRAALLDVAETSFQPAGRRPIVARAVIFGRFSVRSRFTIRRGVSAVQWCVVAAVIALVAVGSVTLLGNRTNNKLNETASDLTNPNDLTKRFGS